MEPLLELCRYERRHGLNARILAKLECCNVAGSAKDRVAKHMIERAEAEGKLVPGSVIIEPTSGNTGIGILNLAMKNPAIMANAVVRITHINSANSAFAVAGIAEKSNIQQDTVLYPKGSNYAGIQRNAYNPFHNI